MENMIHVLPINDEREHEETTTCWCEPRVEWSDPETGESFSEGLVIHNSADGRELVEQAEEIKEHESKWLALVKAAWKRRWWPKVRYTNYRKQYGASVATAFRSWFKVKRYWGGSIIDISVRHWELSFDFRESAWADMIVDRPKVAARTDLR